MRCSLLVSSRPDSTAPERIPRCTDSTSTRSSGAHAAVELEVVLQPGRVGVGGEEVVEEARRALGSQRDERPDRDVGAARHHVDLQVGPDEVELPLGDLALRVVGGRVATALAHRRVVAGEGGVRLQAVRVRAHVEDVAEAGMGDGAVVALEVVLDRDLPVGLQLVLGARVEGQRVDVEAGLADQARDRAQRRGERVGCGSPR